MPSESGAAESVIVRVAGIVLLVSLQKPDLLTTAASSSTVTTALSSASSSVTYTNELSTGSPFIFSAEIVAVPSALLIFTVKLSLSVPSLTFTAYD